MTLADILVVCGFVAVGMFMTAVDIIMFKREKKSEDIDEQEFDL